MRILQIGLFFVVLLALCFEWLKKEYCKDSFGIKKSDTWRETALVVNLFGKWKAFWFVFKCYPNDMICFVWYFSNLCHSFADLHLGWAKVYLFLNIIHRILIHKKFQNHLTSSFEHFRYAWASDPRTQFMCFCSPFFILSSWSFPKGRLHLPLIGNSCTSATELPFLQFSCSLNLKILFHSFVLFTRNRLISYLNWLSKGLLGE